MGAQGSPNMTYAIIANGGKQQKVAAGDLVTMERLEGDPGTEVTFDRVLLVKKDDAEPVVGTPTVAGASVKATIVEQRRAQKIIVFKFRRRKGFKKTRGHRQYLTTVRIGSIQA